MAKSGYVLQSLQIAFKSQGMILSQFIGKTQKSNLKISAKNSICQERSKYEKPFSDDC
jgi:hypothetical protein